MKVFVIKSDVKIEQSIHLKTCWRKEDCIILIWIFNQKQANLLKLEKRCRKTKNEEKDAVIKYYQRIFYENDIEVDIKKIKELNKLSSKKKSKILCISRSTYYEKLKKEKVIVNKVIKHKKVICKSFYDNKGRYGRRKLAYYINKEYNITINPRTLGNYMKQLNLFTFVRRKKRRREEKIQILIFKT